MPGKRQEWLGIYLCDATTVSDVNWTENVAK